MNLGRSTLIIIAFSLISQLALAQDGEKFRPNQIFISPLRAIADFSNPGIEVGYQRAYGKNLATLVSVARMTDAIYKLMPKQSELNFTNYKGWRFQVEQKYFLTSRQQKTRKYLAADVMLLKVNYDSDGSFTTDTGKNAVYYTDNYHTDKTNFSINMKYGIQLPLGHFIFDFVAGMGVKFKSVIRTGLIDANAIEYKSRHPNFSEITNQPGNFVTVSVPMNIRVAYEF